ncbi:polysaccharide pyruvyl transferase family protein [Aquibium microcysteis]|uniref:polysaccharide pyruvyl transferase family protein n=1 Tax=Aquibium microcysteis TaxID=675281 RepID=UPI00165D11C7|nr:polysaccharide pyruvyl transferase family protein [Aquibium microcysteis]
MKSLAGTLEKHRRYWHWRLAAQGLPLWWHVGRPNFGDDLTPDLFERLAGFPVRFEPRRTTPHLLGMGSILQKATAASIVCGSGLIEPVGTTIATRAVAVRGELSLRALASPADDVLLGDPAVLVSELVSPPGHKRHRWGFVPHVRSVHRWRSWNGNRHKLIDPAAPAWRVVDEIASCETIVSQSLHGLIVADALGVKNVWVAPSEAMQGGRFKFDDYFTTLDAPKDAVPEGPDLFREPGRLVPGLGRYRYDKQAYRTRLKAAIADFSSALRIR